MFRVDRIGLVYRRGRCFAHNDFGHVEGQNRKILKVLTQIGYRSATQKYESPILEAILGLPEGLKRDFGLL